MCSGCCCLFTSFHWASYSLLSVCCFALKGLNVQRILPSAASLAEPAINKIHSVVSYFPAVSCSGTDRPDNTEDVRTRTEDVSSAHSCRLKGQSPERIRDRRENWAEGRRDFMQKHNRPQFLLSYKTPAVIWSAAVCGSESDISICRFVSVRPSHTHRPVKGCTTSAGNKWHHNGFQRWPTFSAVKSTILIGLLWRILFYSNQLNMKEVGHALTDLWLFMCLKKAFQC